MLKDTFFSFPRFAALARKNFAENWKSYLLWGVLMYGIMFILFLLSGWESSSDRLMSVYGIGMSTFFLSGFISASLVMEKMKRKVGRIALLMLPATAFEKFFCRWLICTVGYLLLFLLAFKLADSSCVAVISMLTGREGEPTMSLAFVREQTHWPFSLLFAAYFFAQSFFVLGGVVWTKNSFPKTFAAIALIVLIYCLLGGNIFINLVEHGYTQPLFLGFMKYVSQTAVRTFLTVFCSLFALLNWVLAYFRFKESEVIHRM